MPLKSTEQATGGGKLKEEVAEELTLKKAKTTIVRLTRENSLLKKENERWRLQAHIDYLQSELDDRAQELEDLGGRIDVEPALGPDDSLEDD